MDDFIIDDVVTGMPKESILKPDTCFIHGCELTKERRGDARVITCPECGPRFVCIQAGFYPPTAPEAKRRHG